nr:uncharacterized protein LOC109188941 [Ipomoea trifida]
MIKEAFVSGYAGSLSPFIEESFSESFTIVTPLEKEDSHFHSGRHSMRSSQRLGGGIHEVEQISALSAKVDIVATMVQKLAQITLQNRNVSYVSTPSSPSRQVLICDLCGGGHNLGECFNDDTTSQSSMEHVDLVGYGRQQQSFQPQGAYNPNTSRNHPGFSWSNPMGAANP